MGAPVRMGNVGVRMAAAVIAIAVQLPTTDASVVEYAAPSLESFNASAPGSVSVTLVNLPATLSAFVEDISSALMLRPEFRRGLLVVLIFLAMASWLFVRLMRAILYRISRGVLVDVLQDQQVGASACKRFVDSLTAAMADSEFKSTYVDVLWSAESKGNFKDAMTENLNDDRFVSGVANFIQSLTGIEFLVQAVKEEIRSTLADQDIHRALIKGSMDALRPDWMKHDKEGTTKDEDGQGSTPVKKPATPEKRSGFPGLLGNGGRSALWS